ncbi:pneumococcal serine-rich repeat protein [Schistocerca gregaria]|uniref:pneumococcal serine-rich repeat protein n=1 Tax=Schistocerca gregaria TaxID=7010 RepID=UPI00211E4D3E|nr:pneumococcal serine-rich repeat protein [Schistocerca gregaria]
MAWDTRVAVCLCVFFVIQRVTTTEYDHRSRNGLAPEFRRHRVVRPRMFHAREKREISSSRHPEGGHIHDLTVGFVVDGKNFILDLRLNRELIPDTYFERYQHNGKHVINRPTSKETELCQYQGKLRGYSNSWAAISTCNGLRGVIFDGEQMHYLERGPADTEIEDAGGGGDGDGRSEELESHILYSHSDLITNHTCGYHDTPHDVIISEEFNRILRYKREAEMVRGPYNADKKSRYVELVLVVDNKEYKAHGESRHNVYEHCKNIANIINALYVPLNIFIALVGVVVWTENDEIQLLSNGDFTLTNFLTYRRQRLVKEHPNDNAQLLTRVQFEGGVVGKALKGPICTYEFSGGVSMDHSSVVGLVATTVAHEMGHNFGMEHDTAECKCPSERCIMAPSSSSMSPTHWSSCSLEYLALAFEHGMDYCLRNKPKSLFDGPVCGNGFVEAGEQCDCGLPEHCDNPCCNATTCMLFSNASCATGECCDLKTCHPMKAGTMCRSADHECDLPEYCTGQSEYCPDDVYKMDGEVCDGGKAFCYQGSCRTHSDQCRLLWGPSGKSSDMQCYEMNEQGNQNGNCGFDRLNRSFHKCTKEDIYCGMLHCKHLNEKLEFGMESVARLAHSFINAGGSLIPCRTALVDLGLNEVDPGLVPNGAKCGEGKMCVSQRCMPVGSLRAAAVCPQNCNGNGVCNSRGHCHCATGFAPPLCDYPGTGGSEDSGPASDPNGRKDVITAMYVIFLGIVPLVAIIAVFIHYTRRNVKYWWKKNSNIPSSTNTMNGRGPPSMKPLEKKNGQLRRISRGNSLAYHPDKSNGLEISAPLPADHRSASDSARASLLPAHDSSSGSLTGSAASTNTNSSGNLQNNLLGHFKGFTITPLPSSSEGSSQIHSPPVRTLASPVSPPVVPSVAILPPKPTNFPARSSNTCTTAAQNNFIPASAPLSTSVTSAPASRPVISNPILDATTCTAKELVAARAAPSVPTRPAPQVPPANIPSDTNTSSNKPPRPVSIPNTSAVNMSAFSSSLEDRKSKENGSSYPTLTRIASFMMRQNPVNRSQSSAHGTGHNNEKKLKNKLGDGTNSLPRTHHHAVKAAKLQIDRDTLRNLQISEPIPLQEIEVPQNALPVRAAPSVSNEEPNKNVVMRAQSMRSTGSVVQRPAIPTFGSMRQSSATKRPTSIPAGSRPTSPPPRPPPPPTTKADELHTGIIGLPGYQNPPAVNNGEYAYDDCLNLIQEGSVPLANIDEETSPVSADNIYAVIEESPPEKSRKNTERGFSTTAKTTNGNTKTAEKSEYAAPSFSEYHSPKPLENSVSAGSAESVGLLSEIVNEIQARNMESIYSSSTVARGKKADDTHKTEDDDASSTVTGTDSSVAGSGSPQPFPEKLSAVASSNSSLGTYVNAPYASSIYRSSASTYSNTSQSGVGPPSTKASNSSSSSSSGYLSPLAVNSGSMGTTKPNTISSKPGDFSTFKATPSHSAASTTESFSKSFDVSSYKPFSSSLQRSSGPLAAAFRSTPQNAGSADLDTKANINSENKGVASALKSESVSSPSTTTDAKKSSESVTKAQIGIKNEKTAPKPATGAAAQTRASGPVAASANGTQKPTSAIITKGNVVTSPTSSTSSKNKTSVNSVKTGNVNNSPDVVSSCSVVENGSAEKSPDVVSGKGSRSGARSPDVVPTNVDKSQTQISQRTAGRTATNNNKSATSASASKASSATGPAKQPQMTLGKASVSGKQPQTAPKPTVPRSVSSATDKRNVSNSGKESGIRTAGKGPTVARSASESSGNRTVPTGARQAASKLSHVASLQQKFETVSEKNTGSVTSSRVPSNASNKVKPSSPSASSKPISDSGRTVSFKK